MTADITIAFHGVRVLGDDNNTRDAGESPFDGPASDSDDVIEGTPDALASREHDPVVEALNAAFAADRSEPRAQLRLTQRGEDGRMATWLITVTRAVRRRPDGRLVVEAYESYNDPYLKRDQPASRPYVLTAEQEAELLQKATTYQRRFAVSEGSGLRRGKAHG